MRGRRILGLLATAALLPLGLPAGAHAAGRATALEAPYVRPPNEGSYEPRISADGRFVAFTSSVDNLVPGDTNGVADVFVRDVKAKRTVLVSDTGIPETAGPSISDNGRFVAFLSWAKSPVTGFYVTVLFVRDVVTNTLTRVTLPALPLIWGLNDPAISGDGRFVTYAVSAPFQEYAWVDRQVFRTELATGRVSLVSATSEGVMGDDGSKNPAISDDGNLIVFASAAPNLNAGNGSAWWLYLKNMTTGAIRRVGSSSFEASPGDAPPVRSAISGRGGDLAYERLIFSNEIGYPGRGPIVATDLIRGGEREFGLNPDPQVSGTATHPSLSEHGIDLVYDTTDLIALDPFTVERNVFHTDLRPGGITTLVAAHAGSPSISDSGRYVAYVSFAVLPNGASSLIWRRDLRTGATVQVDIP